MVADVGGRVFPGQDARMSPAMFQRFFPRWRENWSRARPRSRPHFWRRVTVACSSERDRRHERQHCVDRGQPRRRGPLSWSAPPGSCTGAAIRRWAARGAALVLVGRNQDALDRVAADARVRGQRRSQPMPAILRHRLLIDSLCSTTVGRTCAGRSRQPQIRACRNQQPNILTTNWRSISSAPHSGCSAWR